MTEPCPQRHRHTDHITPLLIADGWALLRCPCGAGWYLKKIEKEKN